MIQKRDIKLLAQLRSDARKSITKLSRKTKIPISTIYERIKYYKLGSVQKFTALLDFTKFGYATKAHIFLKVYKVDKDQLKHFLLANKNVNSIFRVNNGYNYLVEVVFQTNKKLEDFLETLEEKLDIRKKEVHYIIEDIQQEEFIPELEVNQT